MSEEPAAPEWAPNEQAVADLLTSLTAVDGSGARTGVFSEDTSPSLAQVRRTIAAAALEIEDRLPGPVPDTLRDQAARLAALRAAALLVRSIDPSAITEPSPLAASLDAAYLDGSSRLGARLRPTTYLV